MRFVFSLLLTFLFSSAVLAGDLTPLTQAVQETTSEYAIHGLIEMGSDVNAVDDSGKSVLMLAAQYNPNQIIIFDLISHGANVHKKMPDTGHTALFFAAKYGKSPEVINILINNGARKTDKDIFGRTPYYYLKQNPALKDSLADVFLKN